MSFPMPSIFFLSYDRISSSIDSCHLASIAKCANVYCAATAQYYVAHSSFNLVKGDYCNCAVAAQLQ